MVVQNNEGLSAPETPKQIPGPGETSTPPPSMDLTPPLPASSTSAIDETDSDTIGRIKRKNVGAARIRGPRRDYTSQMMMTRFLDACSQAQHGGHGDSVVSGVVSVGVFTV